MKCHTESLSEVRRQQGEAEKGSLTAIERRLAAVPCIKMPELDVIHGLRQELTPEFIKLARELGEVLVGHRNMPNFAILPEPSPAYSHASGKIGFLAAWGESTTFPHPRQWNINRYLKDVKQPHDWLNWIKKREDRPLNLILPMLDAEGVVGFMDTTKTEQGTNRVLIISKDDDDIGYKLKQHEFIAGINTSIDDLASEIMLANPLRFHVAAVIRKRDSYIKNQHYPDDESKLLSSYTLSNVLSDQLEI